MSRLAIILCFIPRVISGTYTTVRHETFSEHISRQSRSNLPTQQDGYVYRQFDKPGVRSPIAQRTVDPYAVNNNFGSKSFGNGIGGTPTEYKDLISPYTTPSTLRSEVDYALAKSAADARYETSKSTSDTMLDKLKSLMHYHPPPAISSENNHIAVYDGTNDYHMDDDDIRSSSRSFYDNWPYFYHSPYEYEHKKDIIDTQKAKDKRYVSDGLQSIIPVHEIIENDVPQAYDRTPKYLRDATDNPVRGDAPFFSFVLNDYFERSDNDDPVIFKGIEFDSDFDHDNYVPELNENKLNPPIASYYSTISPVTVNYGAYTNLGQSENLIDKNRRLEHEFDNNEKGAKKNSKHTTGFENEAKQYIGFRDFLDNFANKFGSEDIKKNLNYIRATNQDKGENRKGFRRVYHKDEYQEDKDFFDNNNSSAKGIEKVGYNAHLGGSEAYLRSQAAAAVGNQMNAINNAGNTSDAQFENSHKGHDRFSTLENTLHNYRNVAKEAAKSNNNNVDYADNYRDHYNK